jgi:amidase
VDADGRAGRGTAGFGKTGLPLGLQVVGPYRHDVRTLRVAKWIETTLAFQPGLPKLVT